METVRYRLEYSVFTDYVLTDDFIIFVKLTSPILLYSLSVLLALVLTGIQLEWFFSKDLLLTPIVLIGSLFLFIFALYPPFKTWATRKRAKLWKMSHKEQEIFLTGKKHRRIRWSDVTKTSIIGDKVIIAYGDPRREGGGRIVANYKVTGIETEQLQDFLALKLGDETDQRRWSPELLGSQANKNLYSAVVCFSLDVFGILLLASPSTTTQNLQGFLAILIIVSALGFWFLSRYLKIKKKIRS